jgi:hypothetical protein
MTCISTPSCAAAVTGQSVSIALPAGAKFKAFGGALSGRILQIVSEAIDRSGLAIDSVCEAGHRFHT